MFRFLPLASRMMPRLIKTMFLTVGLYTMTTQTPFLKKISCFTFKSDDTIDPINNLLVQVVKVGVDGDTLGYAFCIEENILVTVSPALIDKKKEKKKLQFYLKDENINADYQILGHFENLAFIKIKKSNTVLSPMPSIKPTQRLPITPVQVVQKRSYLSIKDGYIVTKSSGYGIVDGKGQVGSLVIANGHAAGIVTQIGRDSERGFLRMAAWGDLINVLRRIQKEQLYLGISAAALEDRDGLAIARVAPNSPFNNLLQMGDIIIKVNNQTIIHSDDLKRIVMFSGKETSIQVQRQGKKLDFTVDV